MADDGEISTDFTEGFSGEAATLLQSLRQLVAGLPQELQITLLRRFHDTLRAHTTEAAHSTTAPRSFGVASGLPSVADEPAALVNHIALLTIDRDKLKAQVSDLQAEIDHLRQSLTSPKSGSGTPRRAFGSAGEDKRSPEERKTAPTPSSSSRVEGSTSTPQPAAGPTSTPRRSLSYVAPPPVLLSSNKARRDSVGGGATQ